jgi:high-affinity iron transporter
MFLNAVILILQEILEATLLISVLVVLTRLLQRLWPALLLRRRWVLAALGCGTAGAWLYAVFMPAIAEWFDYVGQDVVNALMQVVIILLLLLFSMLLRESFIARAPVLVSNLARLCIIIVVALLVTREGSEIILYVDGILGQPENITPVMLGGLMAAGIGLSSGVFLYFGLTTLRAKIAMRAALLLLALFAGNMAAQVVLLLTQADWLPYTAELWDSSGWLPEYSISGQLLYALIGYEATPSLLQASAYILAMLLIIVSPLFRKAWQYSEA